MRLSDAVLPVEADRFAASLARLGVPPDAGLGLAVSGGADSLALLLIAAAAGRAVTVATVDHGLRAEAAGEAAMVARVCADLGVPHQRLPATVEAGGDGPQAAARRARYDALDRWCPAPLLLTAHQRDDVVEGLLMRLARGSGARGLARMAERVPLARTTLLRPLLDWSRAELAAIVARAGITPAADRSNDDPRYDRTAARRLLAATDWLDPARLATAARNLAEADAALDWIAGLAWRDRAVVAQDGVTIDVEGLPAETRHRLAARAIQTISLIERPKRGIEMLVKTLGSGTSASIADILATPGPPWRFAIAPPRRDSTAKSPSV